MPKIGARTTARKRTTVSANGSSSVTKDVPTVPTAPSAQYHDVEVADGLRSTGIFEMTRVSELFAEPAYNRPMSPVRVKKIADEFDPDAFGTLIISERPDGMKVIIEGQHRVAALILMGWQDQLVPAYIHRGLSLEREAALYTIINRDRVRPTPVDLFRARMVAGDPVAHGVQRVVSKNGLTIQDRAGGHNSIRSISTLDRIYNNPGADILDRSLGVLTNAWSENTPERLNSEILIAVAILLTHYGRHLDQNRLTTILSKIVPTEIMGKARATRTTWRIAAGVAAMLVDLYNSRLRDDSKRLPLESPAYFARRYGWVRNRS